MKSTARRTRRCTHTRTHTHVRAVLRKRHCTAQLPTSNPSSQVCRRRLLPSSLPTSPASRHLHSPLSLCCGFLILRVSEPARWSGSTVTHRMHAQLRIQKAREGKKTGERTALVWASVCLGALQVTRTGEGQRRYYAMRTSCRIEWRGERRGVVPRSSSYLRSATRHSAC